MIRSWSVSSTHEDFSPTWSRAQPSPENLRKWKIMLSQNRMEREGRNFVRVRDFEVDRGYLCSVWPYLSESFSLPAVMTAISLNKGGEFSLFRSHLDATENGHVTWWMVNNLRVCVDSVSN